jgi:hypothetical protein
MCPACIANIALMAASAGSASGLIIFTMRKFFRKLTENIKPMEG